MSLFSQRVIEWQREHGRHDLPWQKNKTRYSVWVSEIMLQQTQVTTVIPYFERFMQRFPDLASLAAAPQDDVLAHWSGLGYYARARNLHGAAQQIIEAGGADLPSDQVELMNLPGIGQSTAAAILSLTDGQALPILDGNVKRVFARHAAIDGWTGGAAVQKRLWALAEERIASDNPKSYNQGLMDLGSMVCTRSKPNCQCCPVAADCQALLLNRASEFPTPKPRKKTPLKTAYFAVVMHPLHGVLVERRPPTGIWGGLWCLPQYSSLKALKEANEISQSSEPSALDSIEHVFSHFKLTLKPYLFELEVEQKTLAIAEENRQFVHLNQLGQLGLPAPIRQLLDGLSLDTAGSKQ